IGSVGQAYVQNRRELPLWSDAVRRDGTATFRGFRLSDDDRLRQAVISNLLCHGIVVKSEIERRFGIAFDETFADALAQLVPCAEDGLVDLSKNEIRATDVGRVFLRNLAMPFDAYLESAPEKPVFSKTL
ncbi:MAG TPA: coproporphyrinogen III oxidase, partial [Thermoanaerobaculia bacterium]|nr:coproporphyrinogen III oxidase [Thermoanaerobaculia bacterium]